MSGASAPRFVGRNATIFRTANLIRSEPVASRPDQFTDQRCGQARFARQFGEYSVDQPVGIVRFAVPVDGIPCGSRFDEPVRRTPLRRAVSILADVADWTIGNGRRRSRRRTARRSIQQSILNRFQNTFACTMPTMIDVCTHREEMADSMGRLRHVCNIDRCHWLASCITG